MHVCVSCDYRYDLIWSCAIHVCCNRDKGKGISILIYLLHFYSRKLFSLGYVAEGEIAEDGHSDANKMVSCTVHVHVQCKMYIVLH